MIIIGIDPGSHITGFGIIEAGRKPVYVSSGCIKLVDTNMSDKLLRLFESLNQIISEYKPDVLSIEQIFVANNPNSALKLGHARGVAILSCKLQNIAVFEYSAKQTKQAVSGNGAASKESIQKMVAQILCLNKTPQADAADALAAALCHFYHKNTTMRVNSTSIIKQGRIQ